MGSCSAPGNMLLKTQNKKSALGGIPLKNKGGMLGKRTHREVIDDFESIYRVFKRRRR